MPMEMEMDMELKVELKRGDDLLTKGVAHLWLMVKSILTVRLFHNHWWGRSQQFAPLLIQ